MSKTLKIIKCSDSMRWYAGMVGELVPYLGDFMGEYKSREDSGCTNFVQYEDAEVIPELTKRERLKKNVVDTKAAYDAWGLSDATKVSYDVWYAAYDSWYQAKLELKEYLKEQDK